MSEERAEARWQEWRARWYAVPVEAPAIVRCWEQNVSDEPIVGPWYIGGGQ